MVQEFAVAVALLRHIKSLVSIVKDMPVPRVNNTT